MKPPEYYYPEDIRMRAKMVNGCLQRRFGFLPSDVEKAVLIEGGDDWTWLRAAMDAASLEHFLRAVGFPVPGRRTRSFHPKGSAP